MMQVLGTVVWIAFWLFVAACCIVTAIDFLTKGRE